MRVGAISLLLNFAAATGLILLTGCFAPPKPHAWQVSRADFPALQGSGAWPELSTNQYTRVYDTMCTNAVTLLASNAFIKLDPSELAKFVPTLPAESKIGLQPYLVRGVTYYSPPTFTVLRFEAGSGNLLVQQFNYDMEMLMPFRWVAGPNAFVVLLPKPPSHVYVDAILGGDWIFRGRKMSECDLR